MSFEVEGDRQHLRALSHPLRLRILSLLTGSAMSSTELGRHLGMSQAAISFHVRTLADAGLIALTATRSVRGGKEKLYRLCEHQPATTRTDMVSSAAAAASEVRRRLLEHRPADWDLFSDAEVWVDSQTWARCTKAITEAMLELHDAAVEPGSRGAGPVSATALMFRLEQAATSRRTRKAATRSKPRKTAAPARRRRTGSP